jgi:hypothetical protein
MGFLDPIFGRTMRYALFYFIVNDWGFVANQNAQYCTVVIGIGGYSAKWIKL